MKIRQVIAIVLTVVAMPGNIFTQAPALLWQHCYGGPLDELAYATAIAPDGSLFAAGTTFGNGGDVSGHHAGLDGWVIKTSAGGELQWQLCLGTAFHELMSGILPLPDGGCMVGGLGVSYPGGNNGCGGDFAFEDFWLLRLSPDGNIVWQQCYGGADQDIPNSLATATGGGFFMAGFTRSDDGDVAGQHGSKDAWVLKTDAGGNLLWAKTLGGSADEDAFEVTATPDGGCVVAASTQSMDGDVTGQHGSKDAWVVKLSANGDLEWQKTLGGAGAEEALAILPLPGAPQGQGGYLAVGHTYSNDGDVSGNHGGADLWVLRLDAGGSLVWQKCFGGTSSDHAADLLALPDGSFALTGESASEDGDLTANYGAYDCWLLGINDAGGLLWQKSFGGSDHDYPSALQLLPNSDLLLLAETRSDDHDVSGNHGAYDIWLAGISTIATAAEVLLPGDRTRVFPNPTSGGLWLEYELPGTSEVVITLHDQTGKALGLLAQGERTGGRVQERVMMPDGLAAGIYWVHIKSRFGTGAARVTIYP